MAASGRTARVMGITLFVIGMLVMIALALPYGGFEENPVSMVGALISIGGLLLHYRGRQQASKALAGSANNAFLDDRPDVLYLRGFQADVSGLKGMVMAGLSSDEEQLAKALSPFGDMIAIGRPGEQLPPPGAVRTYVSDADWQRVVLARMKAASLVVLRAGAGAGLLWEFEQVVSTTHPQSILILVRGMRTAEYTAFANLLRDKTGLHLPNLRGAPLLQKLTDQKAGILGVTPGFICFEKDWTARFMPLPPAFVQFINHDAKRYRRALRPFFEARGVKPE